MLHDALRVARSEFGKTRTLNDARAQRGAARLTSEARFAVARNWARATPSGDMCVRLVTMIEVRAALYDVTSSEGQHGVTNSREAQP